jgi:hypothetical protein
MSPFRFAAITAASTAVVLTCIPWSPAQTATPPSAASNVETAPADPSSRFLDDSRKNLRMLKEQIARIAAPVIDALAPAQGAESNIAIQRLKVEAGESALRYARLRREAADLALKEYTELIVKEEKAAQHEELKLARADQEKTVGRIEQANERLAKLGPMLNDSSSALAIRWRFEGAILSAQLQQRQAGLQFEMADSKLKILAGYEQPRRKKELESEIEKLRSEEISLRTSLNLERAKLSKLERSVNPRSQLTDHQARILTLFEQAIPIEEKWRTRLEEIPGGGEPGAAVRTEIVTLNEQLQAIAEEAAAVEKEAAWEKFRSEFQRAARG